MEAWAKFMTPGEPHGRMAAHVGEWEVNGRFWMAPGAPPTESKGAAKNRMIFGGRYEVQDYEGAFMGMPFQGMAISGYDNAKKAWFSFWIDSMGTGFMVAEGTADEKGVVTLTGEMVDPMGKTVKVREVMTEKDPDTFYLEMYFKGGDHPEEFKGMELTYSRKKM